MVGDGFDRRRVGRVLELAGESAGLKPFHCGFAALCGGGQQVTVLQGVPHLLRGAAGEHPVVLVSDLFLDANIV